MFTSLKALFNELNDNNQIIDEKQLHIAAAVLMISVANADHEVDDNELHRIVEGLIDSWSISDEAAAELLEVAQKISDKEASLHEHVSVINANFTPESKGMLVKCLWDVACADGEIHHYEEHLIRRIADLIYVPHSEFMRGKHRALADQ